MAKRPVNLPTKRPLRSEDPVGAYAFDVCTGKIVACRNVRLACERHFRDLQYGARRGLVFSRAWALHALKFFPGYLHHSKGEWGGQAFELEPWQEFIVGSAFGWFRKDGTRRFRTVYIEIARKNGKALSIETNVATPHGWKKHGDLRSGDMVFSPSGQQVRVLANSGAYEGPCYQLKFSDNTKIVAHARHEWRTNRTAHTGRPNGSRQPMPLVETQQIAATLRHGARGDLTHSIWTCAPLDTADAQLPVPPYTFGAWLGDGNTLDAAITNLDPEVIQAVEAEVPLRVRSGEGRYGMLGVKVALRGLGVLGAKHIPVLYQRASIAQRRELLAGIVDTDGHVTPRGQCEVVLTHARLFWDTVELTRSLGFKPTVVVDRATLEGRYIGPRYRMQFWPALGELPLRIPRKLESLRRVPGLRSRRRQITECEPCGDRMVNCIEVEGGEYLAGPSMIPTHNSQLCAGIGIYGLVADREPGAEVYAAATRRDQARIIFNEAQRMVRTSPELTRHVSAFKFNMSVDRTASKFEPLSSDDRTLDGLNPHFVLIDELHKHRSRAVLDVLNSALGARRSPMIWIITTAGDDNPESVYASENAHAIRVVERTVEDDSYLSFVCTLDQDDEWSDPRVWIKANPNLGISVKLDELKRLALKAKSSPPSLTSFRRLNLNVRTSDATRAIDMDQWRRNTDGPFDPAEMHGRRFFGALDLSSKIDLSCWLKLFPPIEDEKRWKVVPRFWLPSETVAERSDRDRVQYQRWIDAGFIEVTMGNAIDHNEVEQAIREDCRLHEAASIAYDPWNAYQLASSLDMDGVPVIEFVQGLRSYSAPTKELMAWLAEGKIDHGGNPVLAWMAANLHTQVDKNLNVMPTKKHSIGRIDGMTSLIMAIGRVMLDEGPSVYETRGLLAL